MNKMTNAKLRFTHSVDSIPFLELNDNYAVSNMDEKAS